MTLSEDYASRLRRTADRVAGLVVDRRDPHRFHETKDAAVKDLRTLADAVEIDQVFVNRQSINVQKSEQSGFRTGPRTIVDRNGRRVAVETRRRPSVRA